MHSSLIKLALSSECTWVIGRVLNQDRHRLSKAGARVKQAQKSERPSFYVAEETSCNAYPAEWATFVEDCLDDLTRPSKCAKDEVRNPQAEPNGLHKTHRIHWINSRMEDLRDAIEALGKEQYGEDFHLSVATVDKLKKYYHRCVHAA